MLVFLFPGQGSQQKGMGAALFDSVREYAALERDVDRLLGYSLRRLCLEDPQAQLRDTRYTQPALYVVNALHYYQALAEGHKPDVVAGHSLGEYNALLAAGAFDFMTGLRLVQKRGELMAQAKNGAMAAIVGFDQSKVAAVLEQHRFANVDIANYNAPKQIVLSGPSEDIKAATAAFEAEGASMCIPLPVSAAFHSRYMVGAANAFADFLASFTFRMLQMPVIANVTARPYPTEDPARTIRTLLTDQITKSVRWTDSVRYLKTLAAKAFKEIGPGTVLTRLVQQI